MTNLKMWSTVYPFSDWSFCNWTQNLFWVFFNSLTVERNNCWSYAQPFASPAFSCSYLDTRTICMATHWPCRPATPSTMRAFFGCNWSKIIFLYSFLIHENYLLSGGHPLRWCLPSVFESASHFRYFVGTRVLTLFDSLSLNCCRLHDRLENGHFYDKTVRIR